MRSKRLGSGLTGAVLSDLRLTQNHATGGWMDAGNADVLIERFYSVNNYRSGLSLEANYGPIVVRDSIFFGNTTGINGFDNSNVRIERSLIFGNSTGQIRMAGSTSLTPEELEDFEEDWAIDRQSRRHIPRNWTIDASYVGALPPGNPYFFGIDVRGGTLVDEQGQPRYQDFPDTFLSSNTDYFNPIGSSYPGYPNLLGQPIGFDAWETLYTTGGVGNAFITEAEADVYHQTAFDLAGHSLTGFTGAIASAPVVEVEALDRFAFESGPVPATFRISRSEGDTSGPLLVIFRFTGAAHAGVDFVDPGDRIQIESGEDYADVEILPIADGAVEFAEELVLELQPDLDGLYRLTGTRTASIGIIDEDAVTPGRVQVVQPSRGSADTINLTISNPRNSVINLAAPTFDKRYSAVTSDDLDGPDHVANSIASGGQAVPFNWLVTNRDGVSTAIPLGFEFPFFGQQFAGVYVHSNGFVSFSPPDASRSYSSHIQLPSDHVNANPNSIAGFWTNLTMVADSRVWTRAEPERFIIEFHEMNRFSAFGSPQRVSFQIILSTNGQIDLVYLKNTFTATNQSIGLQGPTPMEGLSLSFNDDAVAVPSTVRLMSAPS